MLAAVPGILELRRPRPQCLRPKHRDGEYQRGRHGNQIDGVEDEPDARPRVGAEGTQPAEHAKAERDGSRTRRTLSHACAVSDGTSSPS
jgi:hypothetical protein